MTSFLSQLGDNGTFERYSYFQNLKTTLQPNLTRFCSFINCSQHKSRLCSGGACGEGLGSVSVLEEVLAFLATVCPVLAEH